jgi:hypothetical protein
MKLKYAAAMLCLAVVGMSAYAAPAKQKAAPAAQQPTRDEQLIEAAKADVRGKLKDPDSANFRNLTIHSGADPKDGTLYVCGEVNSKNSYGGYAGFMPFYSMIFWYEKQQAALAGFSGIYDSGMSQTDWATLYGPKCVN